MPETINKKIIYFVRHGQTEGNILDTIQDLTDPLSPMGEIQAEKIAARVANLDFEIIVSSDALRAQQTAAIIAKRTGHTVSHHEVFREVIRPSSFVGKPRLTDEFQQFDTEWRSHFDGEWRFEDEETIIEFIGRITSAIALLEERKEQKILVVTHGYFLRAMTIYILQGKKIVPETYYSMLQAIVSENTGITIYQEKEGHWRLLTWNDYAHLG